jgi:Ca-activated chloride channel family protein
MLATWFAHPALLWLLLASPVCSALLLYAQIRRRQMAARLGSGLLLRKALLLGPRRRRWKAACLWLAVALLALACAGPQWGVDKSAQFRSGRDVIVVLDLSRSMSAEQPSRRELALRALTDLADRFEAHGGNRVALVAFAAKPRLFFPLTQDCDHLRHVIGLIAADDYAPLTVEEPVSGTRIGAALKLALASFDPQRANRPVIVLLSDGDDPVKDDEWRQGIEAARQMRVCVHAVGIGAPGKAETIPVGRELLMFDGEPVRTQFNEKVLQEIAKGTGGEYLPAHTHDFKLGAVVQQLLDADELREESPGESALPVYQLRYGWFLFPAVLLFMLTMVLNEGPRVAAVKPVTARKSPARPKLSAALLVLAALVCVSAAYPPDLDALIRLGNDAFAQQDYTGALGYYEKAESVTTDPGQISFNKAAAYYRLGRYKEAIECYRRALEDEQAPPERRARACYDLGNALQQHAPDGLGELAAAVNSYRECLGQPNLDPELRAKARHNLELAQMRWLRARELPKHAEAAKEEPKPAKYAEEPKDPKKPDGDYAKVDPKKKTAMEKGDDLPAPQKSDRLQVGQLLVLRDEDRVEPASPADTLTTLAEHARRIAEARRRQRNPDGPAALSSKDW